MEGDSSSPLPSGRRCSADCREVSPLASAHLSPASLRGEDADRRSLSDSASTCASSEACGSEFLGDGRNVEEDAPEVDEEGDTQEVEEEEADADAHDVSRIEELVEDTVDHQLLVAALGQVLVHLASLGCRPQRATSFHAVCPPPLSISAYLERIDQYYHCSNQCLVLGLVYIDRIVNLHPEFMIVSPLNVHRLVAVGTMVAAKFWDDVFYSNDHYAKVAGVKLVEMNDLEVQFLKLLGWRLLVEPSDYRFYRAQILTAASAERATGGPMRAPHRGHNPGSAQPWPP